MRAGWETQQALDNWPWERKEMRALRLPSWIFKSLLLSLAQDYGAERRCAGRKARTPRACERQ